MGVNLELNALQKEVTRQRILEAGFRIFAEKSIDKVTMNDVAEAAGIGVATVYRYYGSKTLLVQAISARVWDNYTKGMRIDSEREVRMTAAEEFEFYLESFLDLYRNHKSILRFNQFYNVYIQNEGISEEEKRPFTDVIHALERRFETVYNKSQRDGTLRTDLPEKRMFATSLHLMLAAVTRYAVGLAYTEETDAEEELKTLKELLLHRFTKRAENA